MLVAANAIAGAWMGRLRRSMLDKTEEHWGYRIVVLSMGDWGSFRE